MSTIKGLAIFCLTSILLLNVTGTSLARPQSLTLGSPGLSYRYTNTIGTTSTPYSVDNTHLNDPRGIFIDTSDNLYVAERFGSRVQKFDSSGSYSLTLGHVGQPWAHDDFLGCVQDVAVRASDDHIWAIGCPMLKEFDSAGVLVQSFPSTNPWETGSDDGHFNDPHGVAFGAGGYLYVADSGNQRIQVFDVTGLAPVYVATVGTTGTTQNDNTGFAYPWQIAFDSSDRMYVMDHDNFRVQRCTSSSPWDTWTCTTFYGQTGVEGSDLTHMSYAEGIGIDASDNIYITDGGNSRVLKCDTSAVCAVFKGVTGVAGTDNAHFVFPGDVAIDSSSSNVYISDPDNFRVQKFNSAGVYQATVGTSGVPYLTSGAHLNTPSGITLASDGGFYVTELAGKRLIKMDAAGNQQWTVGEAGVFGNDNAHFGDFWGGIEGDPAVDATGHVYVPDTHNDRVQIFASNGTYISTLGSLGSGLYEFAGPAGVSINPINGDIYVVDKYNQRIQVFTSSQTFKTTLGTTGITGSDNTHFNYPSGVAIDGSGNIFVADHDNQRVQKCNLIVGPPGFSCSTFAGVTGDSGYDYDHLGGPIAVEADGAGRVYVAEEWNNRVQVFDLSGAYLTTISGSWGVNTGDLISPSGMSLDGSGNLYVTDRENHRIQKFAAGVPGWQQKNLNGFGDINNYSADSLEVFNGQLYAGASNSVDGATIWRTSNGSAWTAITSPGFGPSYAATNSVVYDMIEFNGNLYAGTGWWAADAVPGQIWRSSDGATWSLVEGAGFGNANNVAITNFAVFNNNLYAATDNGTDGFEVWRSDTGNSGDWESMATGAFNASCGCDYPLTDGLTVFNGYLYAGVEASSSAAAQVWRTNDGASWNQVDVDGFGDVDNDQLGGFAVFGSYLYVGTLNGTTGAQIYRSNDGTTWTQMVDDGFGNIDNFKIEGLAAFGGSLYAITDNYATGLEVWSSSNGTNWSRINPDGFGDSNNNSTLWSNATAVFNSSFYLGISNGINGGEIWSETAPTVSSSLRVNPSPTSLASVSFTVTFSESVTGLNASDFVLTTSGVSGAAVSGVSGSGSVYTVTVNTGTGSGTIRLDVLNDGSIKDVNLNPLSAGFTGGVTYTVSKGATFADVPLSYWASSSIERLFNAHITGGCSTSPLNYCPENLVTRDQMAIFLERGINGSSFVPPNVSPTFTDTAGNFAEDWIEALKNDGITGGCGGTSYCPTQGVTRAQMAIFLERSMHGSSFVPPNVAPTFSDTAGNFAEDWIEALKNDGITTGCGTGIYCPDAIVTRAQMAVFLVKAFSLP